MRRLLTLFVTGLVALSLAGCVTGFGKGKGKAPAPAPVSTRG